MSGDAGGAPCDLPRVTSTWSQVTQVEPLSGDVRGSFELNARSPVPLAGADFDGHAIIAIRPKRPQDDAHYFGRLFDGRERKLELQ
eukprot:1320790-Prymnesium_polylepis.1